MFVVGASCLKRARQNDIFPVHPELIRIRIKQFFADVACRLFTDLKGQNRRAKNQRLFALVRRIIAETGVEDAAQSYWYRSSDCPL